MRWQTDHLQNANRIAAQFKKNGFNFYTGVPCSLLGALIEHLGQKKFGYVSAAREDAAIGMASGAFTAGKRPVVLMQNSGLGYCLNVLTSLNLIYKIPVLCLVSYRGFGPDAPEHLVMGRSCVALLKEVGIETVTPDTLQELEASVEWADSMLKRRSEPVAIFIKKGFFGS